MTKELKFFLDNVKEIEYMGSLTDKNIQNQAKEFLDSENYKYSEQYKGFNIHNSLLCLVYDSI